MKRQPSKKNRSHIFTMLMTPTERALLARMAADSDVSCARLIMKLVRREATKRGIIVKSRREE